MSATGSTTLKQMVVEPPGGAEDTVMRADRVLGKIEMFINDWLIQLGQGINPQWFVSAKKGDDDTWKEGKMHGLSTRGIDSKTSEQSARVESQNRRCTSMICNMAYCASLLHSGITANQSWPERRRGDGQMSYADSAVNGLTLGIPWRVQSMVFSRLLENQFFNKLPCIIVTGMGQPSEAVRVMVNGLQTTFNLPVYGTFDCGPYGLRWLGFRPLQLEALNFSPGMFQPFTQADHSCAKGLSNHPYVLKHPDFLREVKEWLRKDAVKVELESLHSLGPNILSTFLAENILQANYI